jgi:hypothetical protein
MGDVDLARVILGVARAMLAVWFYGHCSRPALALAGGNGFAFGLAFVATLVVLASGVVTIVAGLVDIPRWVLFTSTWAGLAFVIPAVAFLRPRWIVGLTGGPDSSAPVRFVLCWYRRYWPDAKETALSAQRWVAATGKALLELGETADPAVIDAWLRRIERVARAAENGPTSLKREGSELAAALDLVVPADGLGARLP